MNSRTIPYYSKRTQLLLELTQEVHGVLRLGIGVVGQQREVEIQTSPLRTDGDATDRRESVATIPTRQQRRFSLRSPGAPYGRRQHEAAFIEENKMSVP